MSDTYLPAPVELTDVELDRVTGGLVTVVAFDVVDVENNEIIKDVRVDVDANVNAAVGLLGNAGAAAIQQSPRIRPPQ